MSALVCAHRNCNNTMQHSTYKTRFCSTSCRVNSHNMKRREVINLLVAGTEALERGDAAEWKRLTEQGMAIHRSLPMRPLPDSVLDLIAEINARD